MAQMIKEAATIKDYMVDVRRRLHSIPEIALNLPKTVELIDEELTKLGVTHEVKSDISCVFAKIGPEAGAGEAKLPCILLRADMDGLAIQEKSGEEFACTSGNMHACGHDLHAAALLGAAKLLMAHEAELKGTVKLLFQSAEETFEGANAAIKAGILENPKPDAAYGSHVFAMFPVGHVLYGQIPMGAVYGFKITVHGVGGHGSAPEMCVDPINAAVQIYLALQSIIAREVPATQEAVLTIGQLKAGEAANIIPAEAVLQGTLRTFNPELRAKIIERIHQVAKDVAAAYRCSAEIEVLSDVPSVICDAQFAEFCLDTLRDSGIASDVQDGLHVMGSEDFAQISSQVPSCFIIVGAEPEDKEHAVGQHHPAIRFNEEGLVIAAAAHAQIAMNWLDKK